MTRLRLGAPPAANCRERCSRLTPSRCGERRRCGPAGRPADQQLPGLRAGADRSGAAPAARRPGAPALGAASEPRAPARRRPRRPLPRPAQRRPPLARPGGQQLAVIGTERRPGHERNAGEVGAGGRERPPDSRLRATRTTASTSRLASEPAELRSAIAAGHQARARRAASERRSDGEAGPALEQRGDRRHAQPRADGVGPRRGRPAPTATSVRAISPARRSTPRALS